MARVTFGRGSVRITLADGLRDLVERAARAAAPRTLAVLEQALDKIEADARARWPVGRERLTVADGKGRPHSRDLLDVEVVIDPSGNRVTGRITNSAAYAYKIRTSKNGVSGSPWQILVARPMKAAIRAVAGELGDELRKGAQR